MSDITIPGLAEEIAKGEFADWSVGELSKFVNTQPPGTLRWRAAKIQFEQAVKPRESGIKARWGCQ